MLVLSTAAHSKHTVAPMTFGQIDVESAIKSLPSKSDKALEEVRLIDNGHLGIRVFRIYSPVGRHQHQFSDTYLHILSGKAEFAIEDGETFQAGEGELIFWVKGTDHSVLKIIEHPLVVYAVDGPTRRPNDVLKAPKKIRN
jgi:quercetin dioxygenase-like cupin family protein